MQPRIPYPARMSLEIEEVIKISQDKQKLKEFVITKPALQYQSPYRQYNGTKFTSFNSCPKCKWAKCSNQKTHGIRLHKKARPGVPGWLSGLKPLPSAQVMIPGSGD